MTQYGIRLVINIFDLCIFWRFLEIFIGKRRTSAEISIMLILVCEAVGSIINLKEINWMNLITLAVILGIFICQYEEKISTKVVAVMMYMGLVVVAEPVGYIIPQPTAAIKPKSKKNHPIRRCTCYNAHIRYLVPNPSGTKFPCKHSYERMIL